jgi:hypothetical protein
MAGRIAGTSRRSNRRGTSRAHRDMKKILAVVIVLGAAAPSAPTERPRLGGRESPRATDLLRAEKLAEQAEERLKLPAPRRRAEWKRGGSGWGEGRARPAEPRDVIINVRPPRRVAP